MSTPIASLDGVQTWTLWRRKLDSRDAWQPFAGVQGTKRDAQQAMAEMELLGSDVDWEWAAMVGDEVPSQERRNRY